MEGRKKHTSSLLLCFCLLVLIEVPASLAAVVLCVGSSTAGLGMLEEVLGVAGLLVVKGMAPRPWLRPGVPLIVPGLTDMANAVSDGLLGGCKVGSSEMTSYPMKWCEAESQETEGLFGSGKTRPSNSRDARTCRD